MHEYFACLYVCAWCLWRPEEVVASPGTGVSGTGAVVWMVGTQPGYQSSQGL